LLGKTACGAHTREVRLLTIGEQFRVLEPFASRSGAPARMRRGVPGEHESLATSENVELGSAETATNPARETYASKNGPRGPAPRDLHYFSGTPEICN
jgi:hypothetical protein